MQETKRKTLPGEHRTPGKIFRPVREDRPNFRLTVQFQRYDNWLLFK